MYDRNYYAQVDDAMMKLWWTNKYKRICKDDRTTGSLYHYHGSKTGYG